MQKCERMRAPCEVVRESFLQARCCHCQLGLSLAGCIAFPVKGGLRSCPTPPRSSGPRRPRALLAARATADSRLRPGPADASVRHQNVARAWTATAGGVRRHALSLLRAVASAHRGCLRTMRRGVGLYTPLACANWPVAAPAREPHREPSKIRARIVPPAVHRACHSGCPLAVRAHHC